MVIPAGEHGSQCFADGYEGYNLYPDIHGSNVAGIIGGVSNNAFGISGVAGGNDGTGGTSLLSCVIQAENPYYPGSYDFASDENMLKAFVYAADEGAVICNCSWGFVYMNEASTRAASEMFNTSESPVRSGIDYFTEYAGFDKDGNQTGPMAGGLVVFAAGNFAYAYGCPASYNNVLAVASHGADYNFSDFSNYGSWVDLVAPGGDFDRNQSIWGPDGNGGFCELRGTSQAAPHVSGVAALLVSYFGGPGFTNDMLWEYLLCGAKKGKLTGLMSGPMLDAYGSFQYANSSSGKISIEAVGSEDYTFKHNAKSSFMFIIANNAQKKLPVTVETSCKAISYELKANRITFKMEALKDEPGTYPVTIYVGKGTEDEVSLTFNVTICPNNPPEVIMQLPDIYFDINTYEESYENLYFLPSYFDDPDSDELEYEVEIEDESVASYIYFSPMMLFELGGPGSSKVTVTAIDERGASVSQTFNIVGRDFSKEYDIYPNPVHDILHIRAGEKTEAHVDVCGDNGMVLLSAEGISYPGEPLLLDVSALNPGEYIARIKLGDKQMDDVRIVKI